ncbi:hypothetical protein [Marinomonas transparens]|uniref:Uncharacterized protein n=1 Tax=Marinomonas transparens TaxID=2795388 RepID=A0A934JX64_9GAMM|nr:hypothetical protein [Marinomonas transparens]MBJ7539852.1 hypothetical protein [Marinomonas transparens]
MAKGYIVFRHLDDNEIIDLGGAGWNTQEEVNAQWESLPETEEVGKYVADLHDHEMALISTKSVTESAIEDRLKTPIGELMQAGLQKLKEEQSHVC